MVRPVSDLVIAERSGPVSRVILDRPEVSNALDGWTISKCIEIFEELREDKVTRVIVIQGNGKNFCAGADLNWMKRSANFSREENLEDSRRLALLFHLIHTSPRPVIARVQGAAIGGGAGLVAAADISIGSTMSSFGFSEARLGIIPAVISPYVVGRLGPARTRACFLTGERFMGPQALKLGLLDEVVEEEGIDAAVVRTVAAILKCGPKALERAKLLVTDVSSRDPHEIAELTAVAIADIRTTPEAQEGMAAFLEKRKPSWVVEE